MNKLDTGVYQILNLVNGKRYIGSTGDSFKSRWSKHQKTLNRNQHHNIHLQRAWNKYGANRFKFSILERSEPSQAVILEQKYIDLYDVFKHGYNRNPLARSSLGVKMLPEVVARLKAIKTTPEYRRKVSKAIILSLNTPVAKAKRLIRLNKLTTQDKVKIVSDLQRGFNKMLNTPSKRRIWQRNVTKALTRPEVRERIRKSNTGLKRSEETKRKISIAKRNISEETRAKMRIAAKARVASKEARDKIAASVKKAWSDVTIRTKLLVSRWGSKYAKAN